MAEEITKLEGLKSVYRRKKKKEKRKKNLHRVLTDFGPSLPV